MLTAEDTQLLHRLAELVVSKRLTQTAISRATGVDQSQISRILAGRLSRASKNVQKLCEYAKTLPEQPPSHSSDELAGAFREFVGGAVNEDVAIADLIKSLRAWRQRWRVTA